ncbi:MAG: hypothetical protein LBE04_01970 [Prevotellaceae bacterium]|nr:hypothetical protein [Prevotellaceae bacterium]
MRNKDDFVWFLRNSLPGLSKIKNKLSRIPSEFEMNKPIACFMFFSEDL